MNLQSESTPPEGSESEKAPKTEGDKRYVSAFDLDQFGFRSCVMGGDRPCVKLIGLNEGATLTDCTIDCQLLGRIGSKKAKGCCNPVDRDTEMLN